MKTKFISFVFIGFFALNACKEAQKEEKKETIKQLPKDQLLAKITMFQDSAKLAWKMMMEADDQKIAFVKRLLDEVSYTPKYDVLKHEMLMKECLALKEKRFDENTFVISSNIDNYDIATDHLLKEVKKLVLSTPNVENYPLCSELLSDISALDNDVIMHRVRYDGWAQDYNQLLIEQKDSLAKMGGAYARLQKKSLFQLEQ